MGDGIFKLLLGYSDHPKSWGEDITEKRIAPRRANQPDLHVADMSAINVFHFPLHMLLLDLCMESDAIAMGTLNLCAKLNSDQAQHNSSVGWDRKDQPEYPRRQNRVKRHRWKYFAYL